MAKKKKINWLYYSIELLVVFIGVKAGFILNNRREDNLEKKLEVKYLNSFYKDIQNNESQIVSLVVSS